MGNKNTKKHTPPDEYQVSLVNKGVFSGNIAEGYPEITWSTIKEITEDLWAKLLSRASKESVSICEARQRVTEGVCSFTGLWWGADEGQVINNQVRGSTGWMVLTKEPGGVMTVIFVLNILLAKKYFYRIHYLWCGQWRKMLFGARWCSYRHQPAGANANKLNLGCIRKLKTDLLHRCSIRQWLCRQCLRMEVGFTTSDRLLITV